MDGCLVVIFVVSICNTVLGEQSTFVERFAWKSLDFDFGEDWVAEAALSQKLFQPENNLPVGIEVWRNKLFITVPRWREGVPSTLNYVDLSTPDTSPKLRPYPDWATNREGDCEGLTTTYRVRVDRCDRLWVLDSGAVGLGNSTKQLCPLAIHVFDLHTNTRLRKYNLRKDDTNSNSFIPNLVVDVGDSCENSYLYLADALGYGLIVYSWQANDSWRFQHGYFMPDPLAGDYTVGGVNYQWSNEGVFGLALSPPHSNGFKTLFFHPLSSYRDFYVSTKVLQNKTKVDNSFRDFYLLPNRGSAGHVSTHVMDDHGVLFYNSIDKSSVACWDSSKPYRKENLLTLMNDEEKLIFPSDIRVDSLRTLWVISDRMPVHLFSSLNYTDYNFRVFFSPIEPLIAGTVCDPSLPEYRLTPSLDQGLYV
ncbi:protein yellow-like [Macrosteles quadrilineatus]|uniref:protein yellow-like n=1 Tax=Macrosteles quadrilineatus TaxID=74068 RepID=UPI0023E338EF|nr:protein yellow-like [Macrosteles quadrilineatus]